MKEGDTTSQVPTKDEIRLRILASGLDFLPPDLLEVLVNEYAVTYEQHTLLHEISASQLLTISAMSDRIRGMEAILDFSRQIPSMDVHPLETHMNSLQQEFLAMCRVGEQLHIGLQSTDSLLLPVDQHHQP